MELMVFNVLEINWTPKLKIFFDLKTNPQKIGTRVCLIDFKYLKNQTSIY
jgi:hypothetical protein